MSEKTFTDNLFREEVKDDVVFDLDSTFQGQIKPPEEKKGVGETRITGGLDLGFLDALPSIKGPDFDSRDKEDEPEKEDEDKSSGLQLPSLALPGIDLNLPDIPKIDLNAPSPNLQPAIDALGDTLGKTAEIAGATAETLGEPVVEGVSEVLEFLGDKAKPAADVLGGVAESSAKLINEAISGVSDALGETFDDVQIKKGDGSQYGEFVIGDTGAVVDVSTKIDKTVEELVKGTTLEGVTGRDIYNIASDPESFIKEKGIEAGTTILSEQLGVDKGLASDVALVLDDPAKFIEDKGTDVAVDFIGKATGLTGGTIRGISKVIDAKDLEGALEGAANTAATEGTIRAVSTLANTVVPGSGGVIEIIARVFGYSCYLSTSAYHHNFINKYEYLMFTRYRVKVQKNESLATPIWLGYIMLLDPLYNLLIHNKKIACFVYNYITKYWLCHIAYALGVGRFSLRGKIVDCFIKGSCLVAYILNYKKARKRKEELKNVNIMSVYKKIIREVESRVVKYA